MGEENMCLVVGDSLMVVDATVESDVDAEGQKSHDEKPTSGWAEPWTVTCRRVPRSGKRNVDRKTCEINCTGRALRSQ